MLRAIVILFGIAFIFAGVAGFLPTYTKDGILFAFFKVNTMQNVLHLVTGVIAIMAGTSYKYSRWFFQVMGILYAIIAIVSFARSGNVYVLQLNTADNILYIVIAAIALYLGFSAKKSTAKR